ncbi:MAG: YceD family protein [Gammaproteobacteria bacterium]|nr:YceD family protein [Gammaproteobacteria bacterium]
MSQHLPDRFDPWRFADLAKRVNGCYLLGDLTRLSVCLADSQGEVCFDLEFYRDKQRRACLRGRVTAQLILECQRCLGPMAFEVDSKMSLAFVEGLVEADNLPDELDPQLVVSNQVQLRDLIEDEMLLALPQVPMHAIDECPSVRGAEPDIDSVALQESPFAVLAQLKRHDE